jgi:RHS repeat-associated protein
MTQTRTFTQFRILPSIAQSPCLFTYDDTGQVTDVDHTHITDESYSFDATGNRTMSGYSTGDANRLSSDGVFNYVYDDEGNVITRTRISSATANDKTTEYSWDHRNRLVGITYKNNSNVVTKTAEYTYDIFDRRIAKEVDLDGAGSGAAVITRYVYDGSDILVATDASGDVQTRYLHGPAVDQIFAAEDASTGDTLWAMVDHLGSVRDIVDDSGNVENHIVYDSFGRVVSETTPAVDFLFGFTGRERDEESGLNYHRARYYDSATGRWISEDPISFAGGDENIYRYVGNDGVNFVDPTGLWEEASESQNFSDAGGFTMQWNNWLLGTGGDWLDRNYGGGNWGDPGWSGTILHFYSDVSTFAPGVGEVRDIADITVGVDAGGNHLSGIERIVTIPLLLAPVIPSRWIRKPAVKVVEGVIDSAAGLASGVSRRIGDIVTDVPEKGPFRGGRHGDVKNPTSDGLDSHHMPAKQVSPLDIDDGPAIQMDPADHRRTASYGGRAGSPQQAYRDAQRALIDEGRFDDAFLMDVEDIRGKFGNKYDGAILEAIDALPR